MEEIWADVFCNGVYSKRKISNLGNMVGDCGRVFKAADNGAGYLTYASGWMIGASGNINTKREYIHRLVARHFLPNPLALKQVNHIDCNKENNCVTNLEWVSGSSNITHAHLMGRMHKRREISENKVLTFEQVIDLYVSVKRDKVGISEKARQMDIPRTTASSIMNKRSRSSITNRIDEYFKMSLSLNRFFPSRSDLGFNEGDSLVRVDEAERVLYIESLPLWLDKVNYASTEDEPDFTKLNLQVAGYTEYHGVRGSH